MNKTKSFQRANSLNQRVKIPIPKQTYKEVTSRYKLPKQVNRGTDFDQSNSSGKLSILPFSCLKHIFYFCVDDYKSIIQLKGICQRFYVMLSRDVNQYQYINKKNIQDIGQLSLLLRIEYCLALIKKYTEFFEKMNSLFQYGATKLNLPDKLMDQLKLSCTVRINKKKFNPKLLFRKLNFASHIYFKQSLEEIPCNMKNDTYDNISMEIDIYSTYLNISKTYQQKYECQDILRDSIKQKAFTYMNDGHYLFTYFEQDKTMLYMIFEYSCVELMYYFSKKLKNMYFWKHKDLIQQQFKKIEQDHLYQQQQQQILQKRGNSEQKMKESQKEDSSSSDEDEYISFKQQKQQQQKQQQIRLPSIKQTNNIPKPKNKVSTFLKTKVLNNLVYTNMREYMQDQQDFEIMVNVHTEIKGQNLFYFIDTKALPQLDQNTIYFTYKLKEQINLSYKLSLDNKMGMKEVVENLYLCDVTFKDRDEFRILFSGFVRMCEEDVNSVSKQYDVSFFDIKEWRSLKLKQNFELTILFGTSPSVVKLLELKISMNIFN